VQILDRETLGLIWAGEITQWNDQRIKDLNPAEISALLPAADIITGYNVNNKFSVSEVFKVALASFSSTYNALLKAANDSYALMPPALAGTGVEAGITNARVAWVQAGMNRMTFVRLIDCENNNLPWVNMINKAGKLVIPSKYSVQEAMAQFASNFSAGNLLIDIVDAPGNDSWPLSYTTFMAINKSITALDCTNVEELMRFIAWTQINDAYVASHVWSMCHTAVI
jgi:ABC-type phosphate transport system substrate-binding protein